MTQFLAQLANVAVQVFVVTSMLSVGLGFTVRQIIDQLRSARLIASALVANFALVPLLAFAVAHVLPLNRPLEIGVILLGTAAGSPFLTKLTQAAGGSVALSAGLLVLLMLITVVFMPVVVPLALPDVRVNARAIVVSLFVTMLLPLGAALLVRARFQRWTDPLRPLLDRVSTIALVVLIVAIFLAHLQAILGVFGIEAILAAFFVIGGGFVMGCVLGGAGSDTRGVMGLGTAQRNIAAAAVVATQDFPNPDILVMVVISSLVGIAILFPTAWMLRKRAVHASTDAGSRERPQPTG
jgi:bile acid:Na+ symporter, BASS family